MTGMIVYCVTNIVNGKAYIGITTIGQRRWEQHLSRARRKVGQRHLLHQAIAKHGEEAFRYEEIACARSWADLCQLEVQLIEQERCFVGDGRGYNMTRGGEGASGYKHSEATCELRRELRKGYKHSPEVRVRMSAAQRARGPLREEVKQRMAANRKPRAFKLSPEHERALRAGAAVHAQRSEVK